MAEQKDLSESFFFVILHLVVKEEIKQSKRYVRQFK